MLSFRLNTSPPGINQALMPIHRGGHASIIHTEVHRAWLERSRLELNGQPGRLPSCYWRADILIPRGEDARHVDLDGNPKAIIDLLKDAERVPDDRYLVDLRLRFWSGAYVSIRVEQGDSQWQSVMRPSKPIQKRMTTAKNLSLGL